MAVRSLLYGQVIPCGSIGVVAPLDHVVVQILCGLRKALEDAVYERHRLGTGDLVIRTEGAVGITVDPAVVGSGADFVLCPVGAMSLKSTAVVLALSSKRAAIAAETPHG